MKAHDLDEIGAAQRPIDRLDPQGDAVQAPQIHRGRDHLREGRQPLLRRRGARRPQPEALELRLVQAVPHGGGVDVDLVLEELRDVGRMERRVAAQPQPPRPGGGARRQVRVDHDLERLSAEERRAETAQVGRHPLRRDRRLLVGA